MGLFERLESENIINKKTEVTTVTTVTPTESLNKHTNLSGYTQVTKGYSGEFHGHIPTVSEAGPSERTGLVGERIGATASANPSTERAASSSAMGPEVIDFANLSSSGLTDMDVDRLDGALFLFAFHLVKRCPDDQFDSMGRQHCPYWRRRLPLEAWKIVKTEIKQRLDARNV